MKNIFLLTIVIISNVVFAQTTQNIKGTVIDKDSDFPIPNAQVSAIVEGKTYGAITNFDGEYIIKDVPIGKINISAQFTGYETQFFQHIDLEAGKELIVNFTLVENVASLGEVVITAHKKNDQVAFAVSSDYELKAKQINRYAGSLNDVSRMAMNYAGVASNDDSQNSIIVRGNNPSSLLWTMEGVTIPNPNHYSASGSSGGPVSMINTNTLGKSDFLAGAFPANFGNTTAAAFDLKFRTGNKDKYEFVGQLGFSGAELGIEGPFSKKGKASFMINYRYSTLELFDKLGLDMGVGTAVPKYHDGSFLINIPSKNAGKFRIWSIVGQSKIRFLTSEEGGDNLYLDYSNSDLQTYNVTTISGINHKYFFNKKTSIYSSVSFSHLDQRVQLDTLNTVTNKYDNLYNDKIISSYFTLKSEVKSKRNAKNTFAVGSEYTILGTNLFMEVHKPTVDYQNTLDKNTSLLGTYINWKHKFTDEFILNTGVRTQFFALNNQFAVEPRFGLLYKLTDDTKITFAYGLHSNIHQLLAYYANHGTKINPQYDNLDLSFSKSHHLVMGFKQNLSKKLYAKLEVYYQYLYDVPVYHYHDTTYSIINAGYTDPGGAQVFYGRLFNDGEGKNYGLDLTVEHPLDKGFYVLFTGSIYKSLYKAYDGKWRNSAWNGSYMTSLLAGKEFMFSNKSGLHIDINLNYSGGRRYTPIDKQASIAAGEAVYDNNHVYEYQLPYYFRTDFKIAYKLSGKKITQEWQLSLRNVFNRKNVFSQRYNKKINDIEYTYQTGLLPIMQYRILF